MISKELLSEVLQKEVERGNKSILGESYLEYKIVLPSGGKLIRDISIYEMAYKCKEWAYENDYYVYSIITFAAEGSCYLTHENNISKRLKTFDARNEPEAIFKACQWILENK